MTTMSLNFKPGDPQDLEEVAALIKLLRGGTSTDEPPGSAALAPDSERYRDIVRRLVRGYGPQRIGYVRHVAESAPEAASYDSVVALFDNPKGIGGTHSSLERSWRALGGQGSFIRSTAAGDHRMEPWLAEIVLEVLADVAIVPVVTVPPIAESVVQS